VLVKFSGVPEMLTAQIRSPANSRNRIRAYRCAAVVVIAASAISLGCSAGGSKTGTNNIAVLQTDQPKAPAAASNISTNVTAPTLPEVRAALARIYQDTVTIDLGKSEPVLLGDFNCDGSPDLAVVVRAAGEGALPKLNSEYANWIVEDPRRVVLPDASKAVQRLPTPDEPPRIQANDLLLLFLHGYGQSGWRHPYARQTFLLSNAVGENMRSRPLQEVLRAVSKNTQSQPQCNVISEKLSEHDGFLYWTNGKYVWHQ
jgi:hypothetical protein